MEDRYVGGGALSRAGQKWKRNAEAGALAWHGNENRFCEGLAKFGLAPSQCAAGIGARYNQGVAAVSPQGFAQDIAATPASRWEQGFLRGISRA